MIQPTEREIELDRKLRNEKNLEKRKKIEEELKKEIRNNPTRLTLKDIFA